MKDAFKVNVPKALAKFAGMNKIACSRCRMRTAWNKAKSRLQNLLDAAVFRQDIGDYVDEFGIVKIIKKGGTLSAFCENLI